MAEPNYSIIKGPARETFRVQGPLYCPYDSSPKRRTESFGLHYYNLEAFKHNPFTVQAAAASGSPVLTDWPGTFFGFLKYEGITDCMFEFDGRETLTVTAPEGQELYVAADMDTDAHWREYNCRVMTDIGYERIDSFPEFWGMAEYCTWVEQKYLAGSNPPQAPLNHAMVATFVDTINDYGYPKGKVTIDHGWAVDAQHTGFGDWTPDAEKFPDLAATAGMISRKGHVPGIWIGLAKIHPRSKTAEKYPEFVGKPQRAPWQEADGGTASDMKNVMHFLNPEAPVEELFTDVFRRFTDMGFRKYKIDMSYHQKDDMIALNGKMYRAAKAIDPELEIEFHLPDIFGARWTDAVRTNDVWCVPFKPWYELTKERYKVCYRSAPGRLINRDHIGGNHVDVTAEDFMAHFETYKTGVGYPLVSLLPHHIGDRAVRALGDYLWEYDKHRNVMSDF